jgi:DNA-binding transcriptional MerR regulator
VLKIGDFAKLSRVSVKALRLYAEVGLLNPVQVDPFTGYRYYSEEQLKPAKLILVLRRLDMPLLTIRQVLQAPTAAQAREIVDRYWQEVEAQVAERPRRCKRMRGCRAVKRRARRWASTTAKSTRTATAPWRSVCQ